MERGNRKRMAAAVGGANLSSFSNQRGHGRFVIGGLNDIITKKKGKLFHRKLMRLLSPPDCAEDSYFPPPSVSRVTSRTANQLEMCRFGNDSPGSDG